MSEICFLDPEAPAHNESGDVPEPRHVSSFLHKSSAFPLWSGLGKPAALLCYLSPHTSGRQRQRGFAGEEGSGNRVSRAVPITHSAVPANPGLSHSFSPLF